MNLLKTFMFMAFFFLTAGITVLAGSINEHEQRVIDTVSTPVTHNGKEYVAKAQYVARLTAYLTQDNVDLTKEQADTAIRKFIDNVETGISEGYMEEVKSGSDGDSKEGGAEEEESDKAKEDAGKEGDASENGNSNRAGNSDEDRKIENTIESNVSSTNGEGDEINGTEKVSAEMSSQTGTSGLSTEEIVKLQKERDLVDNLIEKYSLAEEEADVYADLEAVESSMEEAKDYSDAEPFQKGISLGMVAVSIVVVAAFVMVCIIFVHKSKAYKRK